MSILFLTQKYFILKKLTCLQVATFGLSQLYFYCETAHEDLDFTVTFPTVKSPEAQIGEPPPEAQNIRCEKAISTLETEIEQINQIWIIHAA